MNPTINLAFLNKIKKQPRLVQVALISFPISIFCLILAVYYLLSVTIKINRTDFPPQESQLLNRSSIEQAAKLLSEETIDFDLSND